MFNTATGWESESLLTLVESATPAVPHTHDKESNDEPFPSQATSPRRRRLSQSRELLDKLAPDPTAFAVTATM